MLTLSDEMLVKSGWMLNSVGLDAPPPQVWKSYWSGEMLDSRGSRGINDVASIRASTRNRLQVLPNRCTEAALLYDASFAHDSNVAVSRPKGPLRDLSADLRAFRLEHPSELRSRIETLSRAKCSSTLGWGLPRPSKC